MLRYPIIYIFFNNFYYVKYKIGESAGKLNYLKRIRSITHKYITPQRSYADIQNNISYFLGDKIKAKILNNINYFFLDWMKI